MSDWIQQSFEQNSIVWLLLTSALGGLIGASMRYLFDVLLPQRLQQRREVLSIKRKYATPIVLAADEFRTRLENMIKLIDIIEREGWLAASSASGYYYQSTLYVVAHFLGWLQILRRTVVYLDLTSTRETRSFERFLKAISEGLSDPSLLRVSGTGQPARSPDQWVFTYHLLAIGEQMVVGQEDKYRVLDYASFAEKLADPSNTSFKRWFNPLLRLFKDLKADETRFRRIVATHAFLNAFVESTDPKHLRTERHPYHWDLLSEPEAERIQEMIRNIQT